ncbi:MAG: radical SAM protein [Pseudonocardia sp.]
MNMEDWSSVIDQAVGLGTRMVQFIGGEPTLHRGLPDLVGHALGRGLQVEVFSNLVHVSPQLWDVFGQPGVQVATSYYADRADQHESITQGCGSYARTKANIAEVVRRSVPLRVGVIDVQDEQRVGQALAELAGLGVDEMRVDDLRQVGRGHKFIGCLKHAASFMITEGERRAPSRAAPRTETVTLTGHRDPRWCHDHRRGTRNRTPHG